MTHESDVEMNETGTAETPTLIDEAPQTSPVRKRSAVWHYLNKYSLVVALLAVVILFSVLRPASFPTMQNAGSILTGSAPLVLMSLGLVLPLIVNGFDLSAGFMATLAALLAVGFIVNNDWPWYIAVTVPLVVAVLIGLIIGTVIAYGGLSSLIVTLAAGSILFGAAQVYSNNTTIFLRGADVFLTLGQRRLFGVIPLPFVYVAVVAVVVWYVLEYREIGRRLYAIGGNVEGARLVGIPVKRLTVFVFMCSAFLAALGGVVQATRVGSANPTGVSGLLLPAFTAAFLGATSIRPGQYNVWGTVLAVYLVASATTGMIMLGAPASVSDIFNGAILLIAVGLARISARRTKAAGGT
jgi:ribose transport system permease protein